jgi:hypothetical protein
VKGRGRGRGEGDREREENLKKEKHHILHQIEHLEKRAAGVIFTFFRFLLCFCLDTVT